MADEDVVLDRLADLDRRLSELREAFDTIATSVVQEIVPEAVKELLASGLQGIEEAVRDVLAQHERDAQYAELRRARAFLAARKEGAAEPDDDDLI